MKKQIGILTGGGDTQPLNAVIFFLRDHFDRFDFRFVGFERGWAGVLEKKFVDLQKLPDFGFIGGTILKSSRVNLSTEDGFQKANRNLSELGLDTLIVIGGDDTLSNVYGIASIPCIGISKTIDNDVGALSVRDGKMDILNYFTLGYPTAADNITRWVSLEEGLRTTAYSHERIILVESMGMHAGWLAMASAFGKPDFIIIPEFPLDYQPFIIKLKENYAKYRHSIVVVAEGARFGGGEFMKTHEAEKDTFGNPRLGGASFVLRDRLKTDLKEVMDIRNINAVNPSYLYRSGAPHSVDVHAAESIAKKCFQLVKNNTITEHQFVYIERRGNQFKAQSCPFSNFQRNPQGRFPKRYIDAAFYDPDTWSATGLWHEYLDPIFDFRTSVVNYGIR